MKYIIFIYMLLVSTSSYSRTFDYGSYVTTITGFLTYTRASNSSVIPEDNYNGIINTTIANNHGFISGQFSSNEYNPVRRLYIDIPLCELTGQQIDIALGRLNNSIGFLNTNIQNAQVNGNILLPVSTYDHRRYENLPDITDGVQVNYTYNSEDVDIKLRGYVGKQVIDNPNLDVFGSGFSLQGKSDLMYGFDVKLVYENNTTLHYAYTNNVGTAISTIPPNIINNINRNLTQQIHFFGVQHFFGDLKVQGEATYRALNIISDETGGNINLSYNYTGKWNLYAGGSYGTRIAEDSSIIDGYVGVSDTYKDVTVALEYHQMYLNNWFYKYNQLDYKEVPLVLFSVTYAF